MQLRQERDHTAIVCVLAAQLRAEAERARVDAKKMRQVATHRRERLAQKHRQAMSEREADEAAPSRRTRRQP